MSRFRRLLAALLIVGVATGAVTSTAGCSRADAAVLFATATGVGLTATGLSMSATAYSFSMWIRDSGTQVTQGGPISLLNSTSGSSVGWGTSGANQIWTFNCPIQSISSIFTAATSSWYFIATTVATTTYTTYHSPAAGGALTSKGTTDSTSMTTFDKLWIGSQGLSSLEYKGDIGCVKIWSGATLTSAELLNEEFACRPIRTANLYAWYPLYQQSDETVDYNTASGHTLTDPATKPTSDTGPPIAWQ